MFNKLIGQSKAERGEIYTSFPPKPEAPKLEKETKPKMVIDAVATCKLYIKKEIAKDFQYRYGIYDFSRLTESEQQQVYDRQIPISYQLRLRYAVTYKIEDKEYTLRNNSFLTESEDVDFITFFIEQQKQNGGLKYLEILNSDVKNEIPKALKREKETNFMDMMKNMEEFEIEFSVEMEKN